MCFSMYSQRKYFKDTFPGKTSPIKTGKIKFLLNFYLRTDGSERNGGMRENLFTCGHVNMTLCGKMKKTKGKEDLRSGLCFFLTSRKKV